MKRKILVAVAVCFASLSAGCGEIPQEVIITPKEQTSKAVYETKDETADGVKDKAGETVGQETELDTTFPYKDEVTSEDGKLKISIDAVVDIPKADHFPVYNVTAREFTQDFIDKVTETFLGNASIYDADDYYTITKEEIAAEMAELEEELVSENFDQEEAARKIGNWNITEEEYKTELQRMIEDYKKAYEAAPKEPVKTIVKPEVPAKKVMETESGMPSDKRIYVAESDKGQFYNYKIVDFCGNTIEIKRSGVRSDYKDCMWIEYDFLKDGDTIKISESEVETLAGIEMEDAKAIANNKLKALNLSNIELYDWDYAVFRVSETGLEDDNQVFHALDAGYWFYYTRKINNIPVTYTYDSGGGLESMEDERETWCYEDVKILVTKDGVEQVHITSLYDVDEEEISSEELMEFDEIMEVFKNMMLISNADIMNYENRRTYNIHHIKLGYMRIYNPDIDSRSGTLIPVWDFFGGVEGEMITEEGSMEFRNYNRFQSYMTINAIDGTIIDRSLGY